MAVYAKEALLTFVLYAIVSMVHGFQDLVRYTPEGCRTLSYACSYTMETTIQWCGYNEETQQTVELGSQCNAYNALCRDFSYTIVYNCYVCTSNVRKIGINYGLAAYEEAIPWYSWMRCSTLRNECQLTPYTTRYCGRDASGYIINLGSRCEAAENICSLGETISDIHVCSECMLRRQPLLL